MSLAEDFGMNPGWVAQRLVRLMEEKGLKDRCEPYPCQPSALSFLEIPNTDIWFLIEHPDKNDWVRLSIGSDRFKPEDFYPEDVAMITKKIGQLREQLRKEDRKRVDRELFAEMERKRNRLIEALGGTRDEFTS